MKIRFVYLALVAMLAVAIGATSAAEVKPINWGILAVESQDNLMKRWGPILEAMAKKMGIPIKPFFATDYTGVIEAMRFGKVDVVQYGNKSAMTAVDRANAEVFAKVIERDGSAGYYSILVTHKDNTHLNSLDDVLKCDQSIDFGIGDPQSTSGFLVPTTFIFAAHDIDPRACFKTVRNASHEANLLSAATRQVDVATANDRAMYFRLQRNKPEAFEQLKEIWRSPLIPPDPFAWRKDLPEDVKAKIFYGMMSFGRIGAPETVREERNLLNEMGFKGFEPSSDLQLLPIREMEMTKELSKIKGDETLTDTEKETQVAELQTQIEKVRAMAKELPNM